MSEFEEYLDEVRKALVVLYYEGENVLTRWNEDEDEFVNDHIDLVKASYEAGYLDALDDIKSKATSLGVYFNE